MKLRLLFRVCAVIGLALYILTDMSVAFAVASDVGVDADDDQDEIKVVTPGAVEVSGIDVQETESRHSVVAIVPKGILVETRKQRLCDIVVLRDVTCFSFACPESTSSTSLQITMLRTGQQGAWRPVGGPYCDQDQAPLIVTDEGAKRFIKEPTVTLADFQRMNVLAASSMVQPSPHTLRGVETNVYAVSRTQTFGTRIQNFDVTIRAVPVAYVFHYGDGTSIGPVSDPGGPVPAGTWGTKTATSHVYRTTGNMAVSVSTVYRGEYTYNGRPYQPIAGTISVDSAPVPLTVWRAKAANVADNCTADPSAWACGLPTR